MPETKTIIPTALVYTKKELQEWVKKLEPYFNVLHVDIIDSSYGIQSWFDEVDTFQIAKEFSRLRIHLMVSDPYIFLLNKEETLKKEGTRYLIPLNKNIGIEEIKSLIKLGYEIGIVLEPGDLAEVEPVLLTLVKEVMFMGVVPGESGRELEETVFEKVEKFKQKYKVKELGIPVSVDGGFNDDTKEMFLKSETDIIYTNSFLKQNGVEEAINKLRNFE